MPRIDPQTLAPSDIYGKSQVDNTLTMGERIRKRFKPTDTVKVHNPTNTEIQWQWLEESDETYTIEDGSNVKIVEREDPGLWILRPGEQDILQGSCAYIMIEALYKQISVMKSGIVLHPLDEREIKNFGFDDPQKQEEMIDIIFRGKVTPQMMAEAAASTLGGMQPQVTQVLPELADERSEYNRRISGAHHQQPTSLVDQLATPPAPQTELSDLGSESPFSDSSSDTNLEEPAQNAPAPKPKAAAAKPTAAAKA